MATEIGKAIQTMLALPTGARLPDATAFDGMTLDTHDYRFS